MLGWLYSIFTAITSFWALITNVLNLISKYGLEWLVLIGHTLEMCYRYTPYGLSVVATVCVGTMVARFLYNVVRGSGA